MGVLETIGAIVMIVVSILIVVVVSVQNSKSDGITALAGASAFLTNNGDRSKGAKLILLTKVLAIVFFALTIAVYAISVYLVK